MQVSVGKLQTYTMHLGELVYTNQGWLIYHESTAVLSQPSCEQT